MVTANLAEIDLAEFAGGLLYGATRQTIDKRTELTGEFWLMHGVEGCYVDAGSASEALADAIDLYNDGEIEDGTDKMVSWLTFIVSEDVAWCSYDVNGPFKALRHQINLFKRDPYYWSIATATYNDDAYTGMLTRWAFGNFLYSYTTGSYFNAGMYLGYCFDYIIGYDPYC